MQNKDDKQSYDSLIACYLKGELTDFEIRELKEWIRLDKANKRYFDEFCEIWITAKAVDNNHNYNAQKGFWAFRQKTGVNRLADDYSGKSRSLLVFARYAAMIIISFTLSGILFYFIGRDMRISAEHNVSELIIPMGSRAKFRLPDGTEVNLNAGSRLRYDRMYGVRERFVELEGEAYFIVARDQEKPFIVKTPYLNVTAVGTEFNVKAYPGDETIETTLVEGSIRVEPTEGKKGATILEPNQKLTYFKNDHKKDTSNLNGNIAREENLQVEPPKSVFVEQNIDVVPEISWKEHRWIFQQKNLSDIAIELERRYNVEIVIESERLKNFRFTGTITEEPIEQVLEVMSISAPIGFSLRGRVVTLWENKNFEEINKNLYNR